MWNTHHKTLYDVLDVDKDASFELIKANYKKQLLASHPDKTGHLQAQNNIDEIINAYKVLKNPDTRKQYDQSLSFDTLVLKYFMILYSWFLNIKTITPKPHVTSQPPCIIIKLNVSFKDVYFAKTKKIVFSVTRKVGMHFKKIQQTIFISLCKFQSVHTFKNIGDESPFCVERSDVRVIIEYECPGGFHVDDYNIYYTRETTLFEYYFEPIIEETILYKKHYLNLTKRCHILENFGLPFDFDDDGNCKRGHLIVINKIMIPKSEQVFTQNNIECKQTLFKFFHEKPGKNQNDWETIENDLI